MRSLICAVLLGALALPFEASAEPGWAITGTSSVAAVPAEPVTHTVQSRRLEKASHLALRAGFAYLARGDLRNNPGFAAELSFYPLEWLGIDLAGTVFFSQLDGAAASLRERTGLLPDSQKPLARIAPGARLSFGYGKLLIEPIDSVVHLDAAGVVHVGTLITDDAVNLLSDLGLSIQVGLGSRDRARLLLFFDALYTLGHEQRERSTLASGLLLNAGFGWLF